MRKIFILLMFWICASSAEGVTRYVDSTTTGCSNGSATYNPTTEACGAGSATVYSSITNGVNAGTLVPGDILDIRAGTYSELIRYQNMSFRPVGTSWADAPIIRGHAGETVQLFGVSIFGNAAWKYVKFENLIFDAAESTSEAVSIGSSDLATAPSYIRFTNCEAKNSNAAGAVQFGRCTGCEWIGDAIAGNSAGRIRDNGDLPGQDHGIYIYGTDSIVDGAEIMNNCAYGVHAYGSSMTNINNGLIVRNSYIHDNGTCGDTNAPAGIIVTQSTNALLYNNVIENNRRGIMLGLGSATPSGTRVYNNSIYNNASGGIWIKPNASTSTLINNIVMTTSGSRIINEGSGTICSTNLTDDSSASGCANSVSTASLTWTNAGSDDFTLKAGSSAIGTGSNLSSTFTTDITGATRTTPWDLGAYKSTATTITVITPNGGESWAKTLQHMIGWSSSGHTNVTIKADRGNDGTFEETISASTSDDGSHAWTPGGTANANVKIQICDQATGLICDVSDAVFAITDAAGGTITITISNNTSGTKPGGITGVTSALMSESNPTFNYGAGSGIRANKFAASDHTHTVLKFPTSSIPTGATVTSAEVGLYLTAFTGIGTTSIDFRNNKREFVQSQATWTIYSTGNNWATAGGLGAADRDSAVLCNMSISTTTIQYYTCSHANLVTNLQSRVSAGTDATFHLERNGTGNDGLLRTFGTTNPNGAYLTITYTTTAPTLTLTSPTAESYWYTGQTVPIRWNSNGVSGNVKAELSYDGGTSYAETPIISSHPFNQPDAVWTVAGRGCTQCVVKLTSLNNSSVTSVSPAFKIAATYTVFRP